MTDIKINRDKYIDLLRDICAIETPSDNKENIDRMTRVIENFALELGFEVSRIPFDAAGDFLAIRMSGESDLKPVMLMAHMDTVHKVGAFGNEIVTRKGAWLHGPGVMDCKGGIATGLCLMEWLKNNNCQRPVTFLLTSDEEVSGCLSGEKGFEIIKNIAREACAVFNLEPGKPDEITVSRKGILRLSVEVNGKAAHAGNGYFEGVSAIKVAANMIVNIEKLSRKDGPTFNCGIIKGGTTVNTVPEHCAFELDIRVSELSQMNECEKAVSDIADKAAINGITYKVTVISKRPPMERIPASMELLDKWNISAEKLGMNEFKGITKGGGSDAAYTVSVGAPTLCSCGMIGYDEHTLNERLDLSSLEERIALLYNTISIL